MRKTVRSLLGLCFMVILGISVIPKSSSAASSDFSVKFVSNGVTYRVYPKKDKTVNVKVKGSTTARVYGKNSKVKELSINYSSKNSKIAKITKKGKIAGVKSGSTTITAKAIYKKGGKKKKVSFSFKVKVFKGIDADAKLAGLYSSDGTRVFTWKELVERQRITGAITAGTITKGSDTLEGRLYIPSGIKKIENSAFEGCDKLEFVYIPSSVTYIEASAFKNCTSLEEVRLPENSFSMRSAAFLGCEKLQKITNFDKGAVLSSNGVFEGCKSLESFEWPSTMSEIPADTFSGCSSLKKIEISEGVETIHLSAFSFCSALKSLSIPSTVKDINPDENSSGLSLSGCYSLDTIKVHKKNLIYDSRDSSNAIIETDHNKLIVASNSTEIPSTVTSLAPGAFSGVSMKKLIIPGHIDTVPSGTFQYSKIDSLIFESGINKIEMNAIRYSGDRDIGYGIKRIYLYKGVKKIEQSAIQYGDVYCECSEQDMPEGWMYMYGGSVAWYDCNHALGDIHFVSVR